MGGGGTLPALASAAHCASASQGASTYGTPISRKSFLHSSLCSLVTLTVRRENLSTSSVVPISFASSLAFVASSRFANRFANLTNQRLFPAQIQDIGARPLRF